MARVGSTSVILGVPIDNLDMAQTLDRLEHFVEIGRATGRGHQVATVNLDFITNALGDPELLGLLQGASLTMPDGMPVVWGARLLGEPMRERVAGVDAVLGLAERAARKGYSLYLLGAAPGVAHRAAEILREKFPGLKIVGVSSPVVRKDAETDEFVIEEIRSAQPDILLVAFGNPKQEKWIGRYGAELCVPVMIGVGGTLDFISGAKKRAPRWMQNSGFEWTFRLAQEPGRLWRRYGKNMLVCAPQLAKQWWTIKMIRAYEPRGASAAEAYLAQAEEFTLCYSTSELGPVGPLQTIAMIQPQRCLTIDNSEFFYSVFQRALSVTPNILIDLSKTDYLDSSTYGLLVGFTRQARDAGGDLSLVSVSEKIHQALTMLRLNKFIRIYHDSDTAQLENLGNDNPCEEVWQFTKPPLLNVYSETA